MTAPRLPVVLLFTLVISCGGTQPGADPPDAGARDGGADAPTGDGTGTDTPGSDAAGDAGADAALPDGAVLTTTGPVVGTEANGVVAFRGIRYAEPPLGDLRFRPPVSPEPWKSPLVADAFGPVCPQRDMDSGDDIGDEDCLFLNVWAPADAENAPVMFFIHGGGFVQGSGSQAVYDGTRLATTGIVVVTFNYRLGPLGFLATEQLAEESADGVAGNYGLLDQVLALEWIRDNAAAFGGDPANVTIFGESAGGVSVCGHLGAPASEGLFARAIIQSGGGCGNFARLRTATLTNQPAVDIGASFVAAAGCEGAADVNQCLRDLPALDTVRAEWSLAQTGLGLPPFGLVVDGVVLPDDPVSGFRDGSARDVPILTGSNADEASIFTLQTPVPTEAAYESLVSTTFGVLAKDVLEIYPAGDFATPKAAYNALFSDVGFICPALRFAELSSGGSEPAYTYHFTRTLPGPAGALGAFHGLELPYVFGNLDIAKSYTPDADDDAVRDAMMSSWTAFARDGSLPWPAYDPADPAVRIFDVTASTVAEIREGRCAALAELGLFP